MNGQYIYKPPPPPPPPSSGSGSTARSGAGSGSSRGGRGGGSRRGAGNSTSTRGARSRAQPYQVSGSSYRQRVTAAAAVVAPPAGAMPRKGVWDMQKNHDNNDEDVDDEEELGKTGTQDQNAARSIIVPGTSISLNTAQEIEEWIKERRKKWPTTARVEAKLREQQVTASASAKAGSSTDNTRPKGVCKFFARSGRCNNGAQCRFEHSRPAASDSPRNNNNKSKTEYKLYEAHKKMPLFKMLVRNDMDKENGVVLDFIEFLCKNDLL